MKFDLLDFRKNATMRELYVLYKSNVRKND